MDYRIPSAAVAALCVNNTPSAVEDSLKEFLQKYVSEEALNDDKTAKHFSGGGAELVAVLRSFLRELVPPGRR